MTTTIRTARRTSLPALALFLGVYLSAFAIILEPHGSGADDVWQGNVPNPATPAKGSN